MTVRRIGALRRRRTSPFIGQTPLRSFLWAVAAALALLLAGAPPIEAQSNDPQRGPLTGFTLVDAASHNQEVLWAHWTNGSTLTLADPSNGSYGIRVDVEQGSEIGSVRLELSGRKTVDKAEGLLPYSLYGDGGASYLYGENLPVGDYVLKATAYSEPSLGGSVMGRLQISFTVAAPEPPAVAESPTPNSPATGAPTISGTVQMGQTLTAEVAGIADTDGLTNTVFGYQWIRNDGFIDRNIAGATGSTHTLGLFDRRSTIKVRVSFTDDANNVETLTSAATTSVMPHDMCLEIGSAPTPTAVEVEAVPIVVDSTTQEYFVLFVRPDRDPDREIPVSVTLGQNGTTRLTEQLSPLSKDHYRVEKYLIADPADVDSDCIDDVTELADALGMNPLNPAPAIPFNDGAVSIPDRETFEALSYQGRDVYDDKHLTDLEFVKFYLVDMDTDYPRVYFMNTETHRIHYRFVSALNDLFWTSEPRVGVMKGEIIYHPNVVAPDGSLGVYRFEFEPNDAY